MRIIVAKNYGRPKWPTNGYIGRSTAYFARKWPMADRYIVLCFVFSHVQPITAVSIYSCLKSFFVIKVATRKNAIMKGSHHVLTTKLTLFAVRKYEWDTKEDA